MIVLAIICMRPYRKYTEEQLRQAVKNSFSIAGVLRLLALKEVGGNYATIKKYLFRLKLDTSHWTGPAWSRGKQLKDWSEYTNVKQCKPHLIKLRGHKCELCLNVEWLGSPITLEIHHINGDRTNNQPENLQLLCCNCHATTDSWRGKKNLVKKLESSNV